MIDSYTWRNERFSERWQHSTNAPYYIHSFIIDDIGYRIHTHTHTHTHTINCTKKL